MHYVDCVVARSKSLLSDIAWQTAELLAQHDEALLVIDPPDAFVNVQCQAYSVRSHLAPFFRFFEKHGLTTLIPHHTIKKGRARTPLELVAGSSGWTQCASMV